MGTGDSCSSVVWFSNNVHPCFHRNSPRYIMFWDYWEGSMVILLIVCWVSVGFPGMLQIMLWSFGLWKPRVSNVSKRNNLKINWLHGMNLKVKTPLSLTIRLDNYLYECSMERSAHLQSVARSYALSIVFNELNQQQTCLIKPSMGLWKPWQPMQ